MTGYEAWRVTAGFGEKLVTHEYSATKYGDPERAAREGYAYYVDLAAKGGFSWHVGPRLEKRIVVTEWTEVDA